MRNAIKTKKINLYAIFFVSLVCFSLLVLYGWMTWGAYQKGQQDARLIVGNLTSNQARLAEGAFMSADVVLNGLIQRLEVEAINADALTRLYPLLVSQTHALPHLHGLFVYAEDGTGLVSSKSDIPWSMSDYDREYFRFHKANADRELHIGAPIKSRLTGDLVIPVSRRLNHYDGSFAGLVVATIYIDYFRQYYASVNSNNNLTFMLGMTNGQILLHYPDIGTGKQKDVIAHPEIYLDYLKKNVTSVTSSRFQTATNKHVISFERSEKYPLFVMTDMSLQQWLSSWRNETFAQTVIMLLLFVFFVLTGSHLVKQIVQRSRAEDALRQARTDLVTLNHALQKQALEDGLTHIANRRHFDAALDTEFQRAKRSHTPLSLLMIDVDFFKKYNDTYGHVAGDKCLQQIARLVQTSRASDLSARYGGEEFAILLPDTDAQGALQIAETIRQNVVQHGMPHSQNTDGIVTVSIGTYTRTPQRDDANPYDWVTRADAALYEAKTGGRNRVASFTDANADAANATPTAASST